MTTKYLTDPAGKGMKVLDCGDYIMPVPMMGTTPEQGLQNFRNIQTFKCRDDDVMLLTYPKTGTNWLNEVIGMLLNESSDKPVTSKVATMLEFQTQDKVDNVPSPRCLNTHVQYKYLPKDLKEKQLRTVLVVRNPKDMLVSYFNHIKGIKPYEYNGEWKDWFQLYLQGEMEYGMYTDYLREFEKAMADGLGFPIHLLHYEDMKMNGLKEVKKLAKFLGVNDDEEHLNKILDKCSFKTMVEKEKNLMPAEFRQKVFHDDFRFFRKGQIGDWMNWFTVAQSEQFDQYWKQEMKDSKIKFTYAQSK